MKNCSPAPMNSGQKARLAKGPDLHSNVTAPYHPTMKAKHGAVRKKKVKRKFGNLAKLGKKAKVSGGKVQG